MAETIGTVLLPDRTFINMSVSRFLKVASSGGTTYDADPFDGSPACTRFYPLDGNTTDLTGNDTGAVLTSGSYVVGKTGLVYAYDNGIESGTGNGQVTITPLNVNTYPCTVTFWVKLTSGTNRATHVLHADSNNGNTLTCKYNTTNSYKFGAASTGFTSGTITTGEWWWVVFRRTSSTAGQVWAAKEGATSVTNKGTLTIAGDTGNYERICSNRNSSNNLSGLIDHWRFFTGSLTTAQMNSLLEAGG